jgi:hypothetical protein
LPEYSHDVWNLLQVGGTMPQPCDSLLVVMLPAV